MRSATMPARANTPINPMIGNELAVCGSEASVDVAGFGAGVGATPLLKGADHDEAAFGSELGYASFVPVVGILSRLAAPIRSASAAG